MYFVIKLDSQYVHYSIYQLSLLMWFFRELTNHHLKSSLTNALLLANKIISWRIKTLVVGVLFQRILSRLYHCRSSALIILFGNNTFLRFFDSLNEHKQIPMKCKSLWFGLLLSNLYDQEIILLLERWIHEQEEHTNNDMQFFFPRFTSTVSATIVCAVVFENCTVFIASSWK